MDQRAVAVRSVLPRVRGWLLLLQLLLVLTEEIMVAALLRNRGSDVLKTAERSQAFATDHAVHLRRATLASLSKLRLLGCWGGSGRGGGEGDSNLNSLFLPSNHSTIGNTSYHTCIPSREGAPQA